MEVPAESVDEVFPHQEEKARVATQCMQTWQATGTPWCMGHDGGVFSHGKGKFREGKLEPERLPVGRELLESSRRPSPSHRPSGRIVFS